VPAGVDEEFFVALKARYRLAVARPLMLLLAVANLVRDVLTNGRAGHVIGIVVSVPIALWCLPLLVSTIGRAPLVVVDDKGFRQPFRGVRVSWSEIIGSRIDVEETDRGEIERLLVDVADPEAVARRYRSWYRAAAQRDVVDFGTPIAFRAVRLDKDLGDIAEEIRYQLQVHAQAAEPGVIG
jgi:hypothetical protein